jgi:hypothetical protein
MLAGSNRKRERQYEYIKEGAEKRGTSEGRAEEIASRTVNRGPRPFGRGEVGKQDVHSRPQVRPSARRGTLTQRTGRPHQGPALSRGEEERRRPFIDEQAPVARGAPALSRCLYESCCAGATDIPAGRRRGDGLSMTRSQPSAPARQWVVPPPRNGSPPARLEPPYPRGTVPTAKCTTPSWRPRRRPRPAWPSPWRRIGRTLLLV